MKKLLYYLPAILLISLIACNNNTEKEPGETAGPREKLADSLQNEVRDGHDVAMPKSMKIPEIQKEANRLIDSISKLPAKAQAAATPYKMKLDSLIKDLDYADMKMDDWMNNFNYDSARDNIEQRIKYLTEEKLKVDDVKKAVLGSLAKADSLLKKKF
jgi:hypothetical protein